MLIPGNYFIMAQIKSASFSFFSLPFCLLFHFYDFNLKSWAPILAEHENSLHVSLAHAEVLM